MGDCELELEVGVDVGFSGGIVHHIDFRDLPGLRCWQWEHENETAHVSSGWYVGSVGAVDQSTKSEPLTFDGNSRIATYPPRRVLT